MSRTSASLCGSRTPCSENADIFAQVAPLVEDIAAHLRALRKQRIERGADGRPLGGDRRIRHHFAQPGCEVKEGHDANVARNWNASMAAFSLRLSPCGRGMKEIVARLLACECLLDRLEGGLGFGAVRAAGLRHVGPPPPPLPPSAAAPWRTRSTALKRAVRSSVTPTTIPALPSADADDGDDAGADLFLPSSARLVQVLDVDAGHRARTA